ncbi:ribonuclease J [Desulfatitalea alkaliphila]|uniref:Ribonuclease J n=1 Tax=Desulfatitalea alkaliphila TaxID=2929485 RepID=A0AA41R229_9BACT|nr:ribonuclease J [Desulfatitalea alkaliphila]MCJ8499840.1 ribonuclease J [Desulfatitalea alkaliphila]
MNKRLKIIPIGGLGEIGKNMTVLEYGRNMIIVDCGIKFPENDMYGIDLVLPDFDYIVKNKDKLRGIVLTHGHMDHIGGLPYLLKEVMAPVYGTDLTLGMVRRQLDEAGLGKKATLQKIDDKETIHIGPFQVSPFAVAHSIPASVGLVIDTPVGAVVHTGDYKLDETPAGGRTTDLKRLRELTPKGVLALLADSTNADRPGRTPTEQLVTSALDILFAEARGGRIIIATFSSVLARFQEIVHLAAKHHRKLALTGRSLIQNVELARELGHLKIPEGMLVDIKAKVPEGDLVILSTGSQGEPKSALNRMAKGEHRDVHVHAGDTIIMSGGAIEGNEEHVGRMLNHLFGRGANVIYGAMATVHVSGHGSREDMRIMMDAVRPRFLIPVHGETRHLHLHSRLAGISGLASKSVFILENGATWVSDGQTAWLEEPVGIKDVWVDGSLVGEIGDRVVQDRERLSQNGFVLCYVPIDKQRKLAGEVRLFSQGFLQMDTSGTLMEEAKRNLKRALKKNGCHPRENVRKTLQDFFYNETQSRPVILPHIVTVLAAPALATPRQSS